LFQAVRARMIVTLAALGSYSFPPLAAIEALRFAL